MISQHAAKVDCAPATSSTRRNARPRSSSPTATHRGHGNPAVASCFSRSTLALAPRDPSEPGDASSAGARASGHGVAVSGRTRLAKPRQFDAHDVPVRVAAHDFAGQFEEPGGRVDAERGEAGRRTRGSPRPSHPRRVVGRYTTGYAHGDLASASEREPGEQALGGREHLGRRQFLHAAVIERADALLARTARHLLLQVNAPSRSTFPSSRCASGRTA